MMKSKKRHSTRIVPGDLGYFRSHLGYYQKMKDLLKAKQTQVDLISHRRKSIQDSNILNYQNEYNRLRGVLENSNPGLHARSLPMVQNRQLDLMRLGAIATQADQIV